MREYRRFPPGESQVSTFTYHEDRPRAPHLEQANHRWRLETAAHFVALSTPFAGHVVDVVDLGCGDGGLLSILQGLPGVGTAFGVDFHPASSGGWAERGVNARALNFVEHWDEVPQAAIYVATEVLEHLEEPYELLTKIRSRNATLVCSSPHDEGPGNIDASHNWAWDVEGYMRMLNTCEFNVIRTARDARFQVHMAVSR